MSLDLHSLNECENYSDRVTCSECRVIADPEETQVHQVHGEPVCRECMDICHDCGEWLDDDSFAGMGKDVRVRRWELDGKLVPGHAKCVADTLLGQWAGAEAGVFDHDEFTREEIEAFVQMGFPLSNRAA